MAETYDVFLSHARQDKGEIVVPLVDALRACGLEVWYDDDEILLGDDFREKMEEGLRLARFGVVVLSPNFQKYWTQRELSALFNQERVFGDVKILPVVHNMTHREVTETWPLAATKASVNSSEGLDRVVEVIERSIRRRLGESAGARSGDAPRPRSVLGPSRLVGASFRAVKFVGRAAELARLEELLVPSSVALSTAIEGLAGVGKTELARELVHRLAEAGKFPGGIFWIPAEDPNLMAVWGTAVADALATPDGSVEERALSVIRRLSLSKTPTLIVLDNVERWTRQVRPEPLPEGTHLRFLVTTRRRRLGGQRFEHFELDTLPQGEAETFLLSIAGDSAAKAPGFHDLLQYLNGHALALELAGAYLSEFPDETPSSYLHELQSGTAADDDEELLDTVRYGTTVQQALDTVWRKLDAEAQDTWLLTARFAPEPVLPELSEAVGLGSKRLADLSRYHLLTLEPGGGWRMHRLVRDYARSSPGIDNERLVGAEAAFEAGCKAHLEPIEYQGANSGLYLQHKPHLDEVARSTTAAGLLTNIAFGRIGGADFQGARDLLEKALSVELEARGERHPAIATSLTNLAAILKNEGDLQGARDLLEEALEVQLKAHGEGHLKVAHSRSNLATVLHAQGQLPRARKLLEKALEVQLDTYAEVHPDVASSRSNLALVLKDQGDLAGAKRLLEDAFEAELAIHGETHPLTAIRLMGLATVLQDQGDLAGAKDLLQKALDVMLKVHGEAHPLVATSRSNLAALLYTQGDLLGARDLIEKALEAQIEIYGEGNPDVAQSQANLAMVLKDQGDLQRARDLLENALAVQLNVHGQRHLNVAICRSNLALVLSIQGDLPGARDLLEKAIDVQIAVLGEGHSSVATSQANLAVVLQEQGDLGGARDLLEKALAAELEAFGKNHPSVAKSQSLLASVLQNQGDLLGARTLFEEALKTSSTILGDRHPNTVTIGEHLQALLHELEN